MGPPMVIALYAPASRPVVSASGTDAEDVVPANCKDAASVNALAVLGGWAAAGRDRHGGHTAGPDRTVSLREQGVVA